MRIIAGKYRGKTLLSPRSEHVRPTSDRVREAIFNILYSKLEQTFAEITLLDVFAGTGAFALEAISRGIKSVMMIDIDTRDLQKNVALFPQEKNKIHIIKSDATNMRQATEQYDVVFMDAPYNQGLSEKALAGLAAQNWLKPNALCIVELEKNENIEIPQQFMLTDKRYYGLAQVLFLRYQG